MEYRIEKDTLGEVKVPADKIWGAQTERSRNNFKIGNPASMPLEIVYGFAYLKKAAAYTNNELGVLSEEKRDLIAQVCDEILEGKHDDQFPLVIWQSGSGTGWWSVAFGGFVLVGLMSLYEKYVRHQMPFSSSNRSGTSQFLSPSWQQQAASMHHKSKTLFIQVRDVIFGHHIL